MSAPMDWNASCAGDLGKFIFWEKKGKARPGGKPEKEGKGAAYGTFVFNRRKGEKGSIKTVRRRNP